MRLSGAWTSWVMDEEIDYDNVSYMISFPDEIMDDEDDEFEEDVYRDED